MRAISIVSQLILGVMGHVVIKPYRIPAAQFKLFSERMNLEENSNQVARPLLFRQVKKELDMASLYVEINLTLKGLILVPQY